MKTLHLLLLILPLFLLCNLSFLIATDYSLPPNYFINCGSNSTVRINDQSFIGDENSDKFIVNAGGSTSLEEKNPPQDLSVIYQTARIFHKTSSYELYIPQNGAYIVRLHFYPLENLNASQFTVSSWKTTLLEDFTVRNSSKFPNIQEFLLPLQTGKFTIKFTPSSGSSMAFVNAMEVFLPPASLTPDSVPHFTLSGASKNNYSEMLSRIFHVSYRINVGGHMLTTEDDTLLRTWEPDDSYLSDPLAAKSLPGPPPKYDIRLATMYDAPEQVYDSVKELNGSSKNMTWIFTVTRNATYRARFHFCDVVSLGSNQYTFNLYVYNDLILPVSPSQVAVQLQVPFYYDFVIDSDDSGSMSITIGLQSNSTSKIAFLNGLEMMEITGGSGPVNSGGEGGKGTNSAVIIGAVAGGVVFLVVIVLLVAIFVLRRRRKQKPAMVAEWRLDPIHGVQGTPSYGGSTERTGKSSIVSDLNLGLKLSLADILHATRNFDRELMIGEGGFGKVYRGTLSPTGAKVAVKRSESGHSQGLLEFHTEINVLSSIRHGNLVSLIGYCDEGSEMILVYEFMEKGTLRDHLYKFDKQTKAFVAAKPELSWQQRLEICIGAVKGLHYLHAGLDRPIIHRDVKSTNILLDEEYVAKVSDFGLSRLSSQDQTHVTTGVKGSFGYLDPEYFRFNQLTIKSDVYSLGVVLLEVLCARPALNQLLPREEVNLADWGLSWQKKGQIEKIIDPFLVGKINPNSLRKFGEIVEKCLEEYAVDRPSMVDVLWSLEYALRLQLHSVVPRQPHPEEDSSTEVSVQLPPRVINRLPSQIPISETEMSFSGDISDSVASSDAAHVFSQLNLDEAR